MPSNQYCLEMEQVSRNSKPPYTRRTAAEVKALIVDYKQSGLSVRVFCKMRGINTSSFRNQLTRSERKDRSEGFVTVDTTGAHTNQSGAIFAEYCGIKIYQQVDAAYLKALIS